MNSTEELNKSRLQTMSQSQYIGDSFIILDSSPVSISNQILDPGSHLSINDQLQAESLGIASDIVDKSATADQIKSKVSTLVEENVTLRNTLIENNNSIKELFDNVSKWQDDMMHTHVLHKNKFAETKDFIERLKAENLQLKIDNEKLKNEKSYQKSPGEDQPFEMVDSDSIIDKLTAQLQLVEKQRRQVIIENEKLNSQVESLEKILKASTNENESLQSSVLELNQKLESYDKIEESSNVKDKKILILQNEVKELQSKLMETENMKIEYLKQKQETQEYINQLNDNLLKLKSKFREIQSIAFQPSRISLGSNASGEEKNLSGFYEKLAKFDKTLSELAHILNSHTEEFSTVFEIVIDQLNCSFEPSCNISEIKINLSSAKQILLDHHKAIASQNANIKGLMNSYEEMLKDHKICLNMFDEFKRNKNQQGDQMTAESIQLQEKLDITEKELMSLRHIAKAQQKQSDELEAMRVQLDLYKSDFQAERDARTTIASEKEDILNNLRTLQMQNQKLIEDMEKMSLTPNSTKNGPSGSGIQFLRNLSPAKRFLCTKKSTGWEWIDKSELLSHLDNNVGYACPICDKIFKTTILLEDHVNICIENVK